MKVNNIHAHREKFISVTETMSLCSEIKKKEKKSSAMLHLMRSTNHLRAPVTLRGIKDAFLSNYGI